MMEAEVSSETLETIYLTIFQEGKKEYSLLLRPEDGDSNFVRNFG
jgi:hypothetical protein